VRKFTLPQISRYKIAGLLPTVRRFFLSSLRLLLGIVLTTIPTEIQPNFGGKKRKKHESFPRSVFSGKNGKADVDPHARAASFLVSSHARIIPPIKNREYYPQRAQQTYNKHNSGRKGGARVYH
jgi:hypothetical protein